MLKLSTKGEYGVRAMLEIAKTYPSGLISIKEISQRQDVSIAYLEQILNKLKRAGLVESQKGPGGGYRLTEKPEQVSIGMILHILEGPVALAACLDPRTDGCSRIEGCVARLLWQSLNKRIEDFLDEINLNDLIQEEKKIKYLLNKCKS